MIVVLKMLAKAFLTFFLLEKSKRFNLNPFFHHIAKARRDATEANEKEVVSAELSTLVSSIHIFALEPLGL